MPYDPHGYLPQEQFDLLMPYAIPILKACYVPQESIDQLGPIHIKQCGANGLSEIFVPAFLRGWLSYMPHQLHFSHGPTNISGDAAYALRLFFPLWEVQGVAPDKTGWDGLYIHIRKNTERHYPDRPPTLRNKTPVLVECRINGQTILLPYMQDENVHLIPKWMTWFQPEVMPILRCLFEVAYPPAMLGEPILGE